MATSNTAQADERILNAAQIATNITVDGIADEVWDLTAPLTITLDETPYKPSNGYDGITSTNIELRAMHDDTNLYVMLRWDDPTESLRRFPWQKQDNGEWVQLMNQDSTRNDNTYYEDKAAIFWNINERGFAKKGCDRACHIAEEGLLDGVQDISAGRHFTNTPDATIDMWHWKSARTNAVGQVDDQYVNSDRQAQNKAWGRHGDIKTDGGYYNNINDAGTGPAWMVTQPNEFGTLSILDSEKTDFVDTFSPGDEIGGIVSQRFTGPRGDIDGQAVWEDGVWTLEIKRALVTTGEGSDKHDVQFSDLDKTYDFGVTIFDNAQINHLYHKKSIKLGFE